MAEDEIELLKKKVQWYEHTKKYFVDKCDELELEEKSLRCELNIAREIIQDLESQLSVNRDRLKTKDLCFTLEDEFGLNI